MKKRILACFALIVMCGLCLAGCGAKDVVGAVDVVRYNIASLTKHNIREGVTMDTSSVTQNGNVVVTEEKDGKTYYGVYNLESKQIVYGLEEVLELNLSSDVNDYIAIKKVVDAKTLYDVKTVTGTVVYENQETIPTCMAMLKDGKTVYEIWKFADEHMECVKVKGESRKVYWDTKVEKGDYAWKSDQVTPLAMLTGDPDDIRYGLIETPVSEQLSIHRVYDLVKGKLVSTYKMDGTTMGEGFFVDKYLVYQEIVEIDSNATKYDYISSNKKYNIHTYKLNMITGKKAEIKFNYVILNSEAIVENGKMVGAILGVCKITKDKTVNPTAITLVIDKNIKTTEIENSFYEEGSIQKVASNRYFSKVRVSGDASSSVYYKILDGKFNTVVEVSNGTLDVRESTKYGMVVTTMSKTGEPKLAYMDYNGKYLTDFDYKSFVCANDEYVMLTKEIKEDDRTKNVVCVIDKKGVETVFAVTDGSETKVNNNVVQSLDPVDGILLVTTSESPVEGKTAYKFYNAKGENVGAFEAVTGRVTASYYGENNENVLIKIGDVVITVAK